MSKEVTHVRKNRIHVETGSGVVNFGGEPLLTGKLIGKRTLLAIAIASASHPDSVNATFFIHLTTKVSDGGGPARRNSRTASARRHSLH
jgi:hypothetical protein